MIQQQVREVNGGTVRNQKPDQRFVVEGDRLYAQHLNAGEHGNLLDEAMNAYARAMEQNPDAPEILCRMAKILLRQGQYTKAERTAEKALNLLQQSRRSCATTRWVRREAYYTLGFLHFHAGDLDKARQAYQNAIRADIQGSCRARLGLFQASFMPALQSKLSFKSVAMFAQSLYALLTAVIFYAFEPERLRLGQMLLLLPQVLLANLCDEIGQRETALSRYLEVSRQFPGLAGIGIIISDLYREQGQYDKARYWLEKVIMRHPAHLDAHYHLARLLEQGDEHSSAALIYEKLTRLRPADPHVYCNLANSHYISQHYQEALAYYETALHLGRDNQWKGMVAQSMGNIMADYVQNPDAAIAYFEMAKTLDPTDVENYIQLGLLYFNNDDFANAELIYRRALTIAPRNPKLYSNLGYLRWMENDIESAIHYYEKAARIDSTYEIPLNNLGVIYLDTLGQVHRAIELFEQALQVNEGYALAWYNLGRAYSFLDDRLQAAQCFKTAQELNHFSKELDNDELTARIRHLFETPERETGAID